MFLCFFDIIICIQPNFNHYSITSAKVHSCPEVNTLCSVFMFPFPWFMGTIIFCYIAVSSFYFYLLFYTHGVSKSQQRYVKTGDFTYYVHKKERNLTIFFRSRSYSQSSTPFTFSTQSPSLSMSHVSVFTDSSISRQICASLRHPRWMF